MANPWLKKNPFMSMWLSAANTAAGSARGHATAQAKRQAASAMTEVTKSFFDAWAIGVPPKAAKKTTKRKRR